MRSFSPQTTSVPPRGAFQSFRATSAITAPSTGQAGSERHGVVAPLRAASSFARWAAIDAIAPAGTATRRSALLPVSVMRGSNCTWCENRSASCSIERPAR